MRVSAESKHAAERRRRPKLTANRGKSAAPGYGSQYHLKAIGRALDVIECFTDERPQLTLKEIGQLIGSPESSLFRILLTLESRQYLTQNADGSYQLAPKLLSGVIHERAGRVRNVIHPYLEMLARRFDETAASAYLFGDQVNVLSAVESFHAIRMINKPGRVVPPHASSLGKAITAFQTPELIDRMLEVHGLIQRTANTVTDRQALLTEFEHIRARGYAVDREESVAGGVCFGAAITVDGKAVVAALSVSTPLVRLTPEREMEIIRAVLDTARQAAFELKAR